MNPETESPLTESQRFWLRHLRACQAAGLSIPAYAAQHGLNPQSFYSGRLQLMRLGVWPRYQPPRSAPFVRVQLSEPMAAAPTGHQVRVGADVVLELAAHSEPRWVAQLLRALQEAH